MFNPRFQNIINSLKYFMHALSYAKFIIMNISLEYEEVTLKKKIT